MNYIKFSTQTYAQKALSVLSSNGISGKIKRNPNPNHKEGCNFALFVNSDIDTALEIINGKSIPNLGAESFGDDR